MVKNKPNINVIILAHRELIKRRDKPLYTERNDVGEFGELAIGFIWLHSSTCCCKTKMNNSAQNITTSVQVTPHELLVVSQRARSLFITPAENPPQANFRFFFSFLAVCSFGSFSFCLFCLIPKAGRRLFAQILTDTQFLNKDEQFA